MCTATLHEGAQLTQSKSPCSAERQKGTLILNPVGGGADSEADDCEIHLCPVPLGSRKVTQLSGSKNSIPQPFKHVSILCVPVRATQSLPDASLTVQPLAAWTIRVRHC